MPEAVMPAFIEFVQDVACLPMEGEALSAGPKAWSGDESWEVLQNLIRQARQLAGHLDIESLDRGLVLRDSTASRADLDERTVG